MSSTARNALVLIAVVIAGAALYWLRGILTPFALAIFLLVMIDGIARALNRYVPAAPRPASLTAAIGLVVLAFAGSVWILIDGFQSFAAELSGMRARINVVIADLAGLVHVRALPTVDQLMNQADPQKYLGTLAGAMQNIGGSAVFVLIYLGFLLASRAAVRRKLVALFPHGGGRREATHVMERIRSAMESYIWVQTVLGLLIAALAWGLMALVGLDNALFWAFVIFITGYVPIVGGAIAIIAPPLFALIQFTTYWQAIALFVGLEAILFIVGNVLLPRMQAKSMNIDPVVVLLSLAFWGSLWGVTGAFLSTPLTVMVMAVMAEFKGSRWLAVLLSDDGAPWPTDPAD